MQRAAAFNRRMRKTERPVVWEGVGAQSPAPDPIGDLRQSLPRGIRPKGLAAPQPKVAKALALRQSKPT